MLITKENLPMAVLFYNIFKKKKGDNMEYYFISDVAKEVQVESHVLRYWEEELQLAIARNGRGHRYYTRENVEQFKQIKSMKEGGLQLKAIKMILRDGRVDLVGETQAADEKKHASQGETEEVVCKPAEGSAEPQMAIQVVEEPGGQEMAGNDSEGQEKARRLQWLLKQLIKETLRENNDELTQNISGEISARMSLEIKESVVKELDYQFRCLEERSDERERNREKREEEHYRKLDQMLRGKTKTGFKLPITKRVRP